MQALRNIYTVKNNQITIDLPKGFNHSSVEVIILPAQKKNDKKEQLKQLLSVGLWNDEDIKSITASQNLINRTLVVGFSYEPKNKKSVSLDYCVFSSETLPQLVVAYEQNTGRRIFHRSP